LADLIPDWAGENSRLGVLREFAGKSLIFQIILEGKRQFYRENRKNSRLNGKNRELQR
jgi:hypothetical protein